MTTAMGQLVQKVEFDGLQQGLQRGEIRNSIVTINRGLKENMMPTLLANLFDVGYDFVNYVGDYFKTNSDKTDEENINTLVEQVISGKISVK